jgi:hypothetical protein
MKEKDYTQHPLFTTMLQSLILKYGLILDSKKCADALGISTRKLDENRKKSKDCPFYLANSNGVKGIYFPVQFVVEFQIKKSQEVIQTIY